MRQHRAAVHKSRPRAHTTREVITLTTKKTLYLDDALGHAQFLTQQCREAANMLQDASLKQCVQQFAEQHCQMYGRFYDLV